MKETLNINGEYIKKDKLLEITLIVVSFINLLLLSLPMYKTVTLFIYENNYIQSEIFGKSLSITFFILWLSSLLLSFINLRIKFKSLI